jgi:hypothetical protein
MMVSVLAWMLVSERVTPARSQKTDFLARQHLAGMVREREELPLRASVL